MNCNFNGNCNRCKKFIKSESIELTGNGVEIKIPSIELKNKDIICICLTQNIPAGVTNDSKVVINVDGTFLTLKK